MIDHVKIVVIANVAREGQFIGNIYKITEYLSEI